MSNCPLDWWFRGLPTRKQSWRDVNRMALEAKRSNEPSAEHQAIVCLAPLLKLLCRRYCRRGRACHLACRVGDLLCMGYVDMHDLLKSWNPDLKGFTAYVATYLPRRLRSDWESLGSPWAARERIESPLEEIQDLRAQDPENEYKTRWALEQVFAETRPIDEFIIRMHHGEDRGYEKIAQELGGISPSAVKQRCYRALRSIRMRKHGIAGGGL